MHYLETGKIRYGAYITWLSILELKDDRKLFLQEISADTEKMRRYRRKTPFVGILTEAERQQALYKDAIGDIDDIRCLF
ncbi:hypothetical protein [Thalassotalea maritima]|uniref:hypothetical protein n=1 Tax=Thalassotalea maritima TaxID=3242416 RepID=UPI0035297263